MQLVKFITLLIKKLKLSELLIKFIIKLLIMFINMLIKIQEDNSINNDL